MARVSRNASIPYRPYSRPTPEYLKPPQGACESSVMPLITTRPDRIRDATRRARWRSVPRTAAWRPYFESLAIRIASSAAGEHLCAFLDALADIRLHALVLLLRHHRSD